MYDYDSNAILKEELKDRSASSLTQAWKNAYARLTHNGHKTKLMILDNEISAEFVAALDKEKISYQLAPPGNHRTNAAERAIQTFKHHFLAGLASCHPDFPIREWDRILDQAELTLNLLRNSRVNPSLSAWAYLFGNHDFNKVPLAPPGTKVLVHTKAAERASWEYHGKEGFYVGPAPKHYRCVSCWMTKSHAPRTTDTVTLVPHLIPIPHPDINDHIRATAENLLLMLANKKFLIGPNVKESTKDSMLRLARILGQDTTKPTPLPTYEGVGNATGGGIFSEGAKSNPLPFTPVLDHPNPFTKLNDNVPGLPIHPQIYSKTTKKGTKDSLPVKPITFTNPFAAMDKIIHENVKTTDKAKFHKFLRSYVREHKPPQQKQPTTIKQTINRHPHPHLLKIPSPKMQPKSQRQHHPMKLRLHNRYQYPHHSHSFKHLAVQHIVDNCMQSNIPDSPEQIQHIFSSKGIKMSIDQLIQEEPKTWRESVSNEIGRMAQGIRNVKGNNVLVFIPRHEVPANKKVTYGNMICDFRPLKLEKYRVRLTVGGDRLDYLGNQSSPAASLLETKMLLNSVISDAKDGARFMTMDLKDHFLQSTLIDPQYMRIHSKYFFDDIKQKYNIDSIIASDGYVYCKIIKGMYGLKEAAMLAREKIMEILKPLGYYPDTQSPNIWYHHTRRTKFILCVDDFGVKYYSQEDVEHLKSALQQVYDVTTDYTGQNYCGLSLAWNYQAGHVDVSMPKFVEKALQKLQHINPKKPQNQPHKHVAPIFGQQQQFTAPLDDSSFYLTRKQDTYKVLWDPFFIMPELLIPPSYLQSMNWV